MRPGGAPVAVLIATRGRPDSVGVLLRHLAGQSRPPDHVVIVGTQPADVAGLEPSDNRTIVLGPAGLAAQRNAALRIAAARFGTLVFFDDDFVPSQFWIEQAVRIFGSRPDLAALTGTVLADGIKTAGIPIHEAESIVAQRDAIPSQEVGLVEGIGPYGCNMAFRASAIEGLGFDERLPLYGWLEDADFGARVAERGAMARAHGLWGVHLGQKSGRVAGVRLGYSQIANPVYLTRKGTVPLAFSTRLMGKNILANLARCLRPEPFIDRAGRLRGNLLALADVLRGRVTPERAALL